MTNKTELPDLDRRTHELKTDPTVFEAVVAGAKTHEIRLNDRGFQVGDELVLRETTATGADMRLLPRTYPLTYTGRAATRIVSHIQTGYGLADGWCILSFARRAQPEGEAPQAGPVCTCPSGDGSLRWPCPAHPPAAQQAESGAPLGYISEDGAGMLKAGRPITVNVAMSKSGPWSVPIYLAAQSQGAPVGYVRESTLARLGSTDSTGTIWAKPVAEDYVPVCRAPLAAKAETSTSTDIANVILRLIGENVMDWRAGLSSDDPEEDAFHSDAEELRVLVDLVNKARAAQQAAAPQIASIPDILFSGNEVYEEIVSVHGKAYCGSPSVVSDTLDAVVRLLRREGAETNYGTSAPGTPEAPKKPAHGHRDDYYLLANGRRLGLEPISRVRNMPNWVLAMELFATGSTSAHQICRDAGIDPDSTTTQRAAQLDGGQGEVDE